MKALSLVSLPHMCWLRPTSRIHFLNPLSRPQISPPFAGLLRSSSTSTLLKKTSFLGIINSSDPKKQSQSDLFLDENGLVDDMEGYINHLSLEYDSVWDTKPYWCQPWTITLTGVSIIAGSWLILHSVLGTVVILTLICTWWYIFLYSYPKAYSEMIAERRKRVTSGVEDTYGQKRNQ